MIHEYPHLLPLLINHLLPQVTHLLHHVVQARLASLRGIDSGNQSPLGGSRAGKVMGYQRNMAIDAIDKVDRIRLDEITLQ